MPVVGIPVKLLTAQLGIALGREVLVEHLMHLGCDVEGYATLRRFKCARCGNILEITATQDPPVECRRCGVRFTEVPGARLDLGETEVIRMELLAVRPDVFDPGGLARLLRGYLGMSRGRARYAAQPPVARVTVNPVTQTPTCPRPAIACAVLRNVRLDDDLIKVVMNLQENLHWALGRDRKHASIGVYDLGAVGYPEFRYRGVAPDGLRFVPLGYDPAAPGSAITPRQVLAEHPKGVEFARLLEGFAEYPLLTDGAGKVLSLPPIINSEDTRVTDATTSFFIDVTGTSRRIVSRTLNVLVTSLLELCPEIALEQVTVAYPDGAVVTPDFAPQVVRLPVTATARLIGVDLDAAALGDLLLRMGHDVTALDADTLQVEVPAYRCDILHPRDLMEDAAIAYGYHNLVPVLVPTMTVGGERPVERTGRTVRETLTGIGYLEAMTLVLTCEERAYDALQLPRDEAHVQLENPISSEQTMLRVSVLPGLLDTLTVNAHRDYPQRLFEVGEVTVIEETAETGAEERRTVGGVVIGDKVGFTEARQGAEAVLRELGYSIRTANEAHPTFLPGRSAAIFARRGAGDEVRVGRLGELHPTVLDAFKLRYPASTFEIDLTALTGEK